MNREFIPYEQAVEINDLGFNEDCLAFYILSEKRNINSPFLRITNIESEKILNAAHKIFDVKYVLTPLYQQAFRFFREKYFLGHGINPYSLDAHLIDLEDCIFYDIDDVYTYEEAELACLKKIIEIVKNK